ncbi:MULTISPECIES: aminomethyltransferase family protein [unclassified Methylophaga]|jgi:aminomethyltransferase|uniref:aminomethyltransferase family protein n=1 Tax=unclassified Methylophaga TaxID=2629249 RepID=UPI00259CA351|nr:MULTISPECIES: aminomethyltransferase family protein [unclassified Methylophaga]|tara:strand:- start:35006 stop:36139 length:1134 start_codon:yes stop_codon:yes gene_type:complete
MNNPLPKDTITRNSVLNVRHKELGSTLDGETWNGMPIPWSYHTDVNDEVVAVRTRAGLYDVSGLNIVNVSGPAALKILDRLVTIDVTKLEPGTSRLAGEVNEEGALVDDIMVICDDKEHYRLSHGSGATQQTLAELAKGEDVTVEQDYDVHILSLQGPRSIDILDPELDFNLAELPYFKHIKTTLFGREVILARGGYSGERGYEVYCAAADAVYLWDMILEKGQPYGCIPASWDSLDLTRVEAALLFFPFDMPEGDTTPWEVNMDWCVDLDKPGDYIGKDAVLKLKGRERFKQIGLECMTNQAVEIGAKLLIDGKQVGVITSASYSQYLMKSIAMAHIKPQYSQLGTAVTIDSDKPFKATIVKMPFYDPMRMRTHPK